MPSLGDDASRDGTLGLSTAASTLGLLAIQRELEAQGVPKAAFLEHSGIPEDWFETGQPELSHAERLALIRSAQQLATLPDTGLRAGRRQRIRDLGLYGYAMASSATFGEAMRFAFAHQELLATFLRITYETEDGKAILRSHNPHSLGPLLPFFSELWRSSSTTVFAQILGHAFPSMAMYFPYPAPKHARAYEEAFQCAIHFDAAVFEWHFDANVLDRQCCNADEITSMVCVNFCEHIMERGGGQSHLQREVRLCCIGRPGRRPTGAEVAAQLGMSRRSLFRRLNEEGVTFQELLDEVCSTLSIDYLTSTRLTVEEIAFRVGFADPSNFRKAFRRWTGRSPSQFRSG